MLIKLDYLKQTKQKNLWMSGKSDHRQAHSIRISGSDPRLQPNRVTFTLVTTISFPHIVILIAKRQEMIDNQSETVLCLYSRNTGTIVKAPFANSSFFTGLFFNFVVVAMRATACRSYLKGELARSVFREELVKCEIFGDLVGYIQQNIRCGGVNDRFNDLNEIFVVGIDSLVHGFAQHGIVAEEVA